MKFLIFLYRLPEMLGLGETNSNVRFTQSDMIGFFRNVNIDSWAPKSREYSTCTFIDGSLVMFGGLNGTMMNDVNIFDLRAWKWTEVKYTQATKSNSVPEPRYGHSAVAYGSYVVVYGGYRRFISSFKVRDTYGDVSLFNTDTMKWEKPI
jgi:N-acetylneuraminic acid mutarotase